MYKHTYDGLTAWTPNQRHMEMNIFLWALERIHILDNDYRLVSLHLCMLNYNWNSPRLIYNVVEILLSEFLCNTTENLIYPKL